MKTIRTHTCKIRTFRRLSISILLFPLTCSLCLFTMKVGLLCLLLLFCITPSFNNSLICNSYSLIFSLVDSIFLFCILNSGSLNSNLHNIIFFSQCFPEFSPIISSLANLLRTSSISKLLEESKL